MRALTAQLFILICFCAGLFHTTAQQSVQPTNTLVPQTQSAQSQNGNQAEKADPSKDYREMFKDMLDQAKWFFGAIGAVVLLLGGVIVWLVIWTFKQSREDAKKVFQEEIQKRGIATLESEFRNLQAQYNALNAFKDRRVDWVRPESMAEPKKELAFLERAGLKHVSPIEVKTGEPGFLLNAPDLVILSFDGSQQSKDLVKSVVDLLKRSQKETPMLVYAPLGLRVDLPEMELLNETALHAIANFPATLVTQALELVRLRQS